jgi:hypothetical protein
MITALALQIGIGITQFGHHSDGIWYQQAFPHDLNTRAESISIGLANDKYRFGIEALGTVKTFAVATSSDADYQANGGAAQWPISHWYGTGSVSGLYASRVWTQGYVSAELGLYAYRPTWSETIPDWRECKDCPAQYLKVTHQHSWAATPYVGLGITSGNTQFMVTARQTQTRGDKWTAYYSGISYNAAIRYTFR